VALGQPGGRGEVSHKVTRATYVKLIEEDLAWLLQQPKTLERDHIVLILKESVKCYYPETTDADSSRRPS
jgi:hypothetical protein